MTNEEMARDILGAAKDIFVGVEECAPSMILKNPSKYLDWDNTNSYCYIDYPLVYGVITRKENGIDYSVQATVEYINEKGEKRGFAKIRIYEEAGKIQLKGKRSGGNYRHDIYDDDFLVNPDEDLPKFLQSMRTNLLALRDQIGVWSTCSVETFEPEVVRFEKAARKRKVKEEYDGPKLLSVD